MFGFKGKNINSTSKNFKNHFTIGKFVIIWFILMPEKTKRSYNTKFCGLKIKFPEN